MVIDYAPKAPPTYDAKKLKNNVQCERITEKSDFLKKLEDQQAAASKRAGNVKYLPHSSKR